MVKKHRLDILLLVTSLIVVSLCLLYWYTPLKFVISNWGELQVCPQQNVFGEAALKSMRTNLEAISKYKPESVIRASVFFQNGTIPVSDIFEIFSKYHFELTTDKPQLYGQESSISLIYPINDDGIEGAILTADMLSNEGMEKFFKNKSLHAIAMHTNLDNFQTDQLGTIGFYSFARAKDLLALWNENPNLIKGVGIGCTQNFTYIKNINELTLYGK